ncbi:hypothetical protein GW916_04115 [bacterium]|nr:hypothetical protein [bacterium]
MKMEKLQFDWVQTYFGTSPYAFLDDLKNQKWDRSYLFSSLHEPLSQLALSFYCNSHSNHGVQIDSQEISSIVNSFLIYMEEQDSWSTIWHQCEKNPENFDLFLSLSRYFLRFNETKPKRERHEPSYSSKRSLLELPLPVNHIKDGIMYAMSSATNSLPENCRLSYQLHLEGLLNHEIAFLLQESESSIEDHIEQAKQNLKTPDAWRVAS